ncbi:MAG: group 1 truncated hemoglobin [Alphaproteobacteria bacterium]|nr:group 1 truncated hemoglobin [Alphaproteobacteria bacterium]
MKSLFERIGGIDAIRATVVKLYERLLTDGRLSPFFEGIDIETLRRSQNAFLTMATGGPNNYTGEGLRHAHARLVKVGLSDEHFDAVITHMGEAMSELGVEKSLINEAAALVETTRADVLNK